MLSQFPEWQLEQPAFKDIFSGAYFATQIWNPAQMAHNTAKHRIAII
ncbi:hypothetical protein BGP_3015 [Beggiatoa sp. PS]|nr:hypothetical protein BGP_3015 [Beggiatoa sp. PS]